MHRINYLLKDGFQVLALATQAVFEYANVVAGEPSYQIDNFSLAGGATRSSLGLTITVQPLSASSGADTWMVVGVGNPLETPTSDEEMAFLRHSSLHARRLASICTGAFLLAEPGCCTSGARRRTGTLQPNYRNATRRSRSKRTASTSLTDRSGPRPA